VQDSRQVDGEFRGRGQGGGVSELDGAPGFERGKTEVRSHTCTEGGQGQVRPRARARGRRHRGGCVRRR